MSGHQASQDGQDGQRTGRAGTSAGRDPDPRRRDEDPAGRGTDPAGRDQDPAGRGTDSTRRDRDPAGRPRNARPRDALGRPLPKGAQGVERVPDEYAPGTGQAVADALAYLAEERPFHAHEVLEARWKTGPDDERELWQGLAQICVGLTHLQRGNTRGAATLLGRGADRVARYDAGSGGAARPIDVAAAVRAARDLAEHPATPPSVAVARVADAFRAARPS
ncbi:DUF309 domain-containing protein [Sphaerisporangium dianthi]|uniref:DUF309 domain-containing protein n=1 Tax=Sphaerisporangium dianthi TaxID=1436120 RepID=A0ABV9CA49_9ACTN